MKPFTHLLVPVDFSPYSSAAVRLAADIARRYDAKITLVHVYEPIAYALPDGFALVSAEELTRALDQMKKQLETIKAEAEGAGAPRVTITQEQGVAATEIVHLAREQKVDLIVMGTHGRKGLTHAVMGSVAERVVRSAPCPVLTLKAEKS